MEVRIIQPIAKSGHSGPRGCMLKENYTAALTWATVMGFGGSPVQATFKEQ